jgi:hypothetical protein
LKLLDNYSKVLIGISILGIAVGLYSLFFFSHKDNTRNPEDRVAEVLRPNNDTRLKRSGDIHWFPVSQTIDAFDEDTIFTGKDSVATIKFKDGGEVTLLPMSLITISKGNVTLNSGTIEVNLEKGALKVESFGEKFEIKEKTTFKVQNTAEVKRITPIAKTKEAEAKVAETFSKIAAVKNYVQTQSITITAPATGDRLPKFAGSSLNVRWKASAVSANNSFKVEFSPTDTFETISFTTETPFTNVKVPVESLASGINYFRVKESKGTAKADSSLFLIEDVKIEYLQPSNLSDYPLNQVEAQGVLFEWTTTLNFPQRIQVARSPDFQTPVHEETLQGTQKNFNFTEEGQYYWRVGHVLEKSVFWSNVSTFTLSKEIPVSPLEFNSFAKVMDFRLTPQYEVSVHDLNKCEEFEFTITNGDKVIAQSTTKKPVIKLKKLVDGTYQVKVVGKVNDKKQTEPALREFTVKNSLPLKAPKIKNKKNVKLFVQFIQKALDFIFPSAHAAAPTPYYVLAWEPEAGDAVYEIEVAKTKPENIVIRQKLKETSFKFPVPGPETFYWRVRSFVNNEWSPFSEFAVVQVEDRIRRISDALMIQPEDGSKIELKGNKPTIEFTWNEPDKKVNYFLELSTKADGSNARLIKVHGGSHSVTFKRFPKELYWRVFAESQFKNRSKNSDVFKLSTFRVEEPVEINKPTKYVLRGSGYFAQSANVMDFSEVNLAKLDENLTGTIFEFNAEYLPGRWNYRRSLNLYARVAQLSSAETTLTEKKLGIEYGWLSPVENETKHNLYAGIHLYDNMSFKFGSDIQGSYDLMFLSARYLYRRPISEKFNFEMNTGLQIPGISFNPLIILRPGVNYKLNKKWWIDFYALFERFSHKLQDTEANNNVKIQYQNISLGAGFTYFIGD